MRHLICPQCGASVEVPPSPTRKALGRLGGKARSQNLTPQRRQDIARAAALKRWSKPSS